MQAMDMQLRNRIRVIIASPVKLTRDGIKAILHDHRMWRWRIPWISGHKVWPSLQMKDPARLSLMSVKQI
jgi:hypothetical protein